MVTIETVLATAIHLVDEERNYVADELHKLRTQRKQLMDKRIPDEDMLQALNELVRSLVGEFGGLSTAIEILRKLRKSLRE